MKKVFTILTAVLCMSCVPTQSFATPSDDTEEQDFGTELDFLLNLDTSKGGTRNPKTPLLKPRVLQFGHTLQLITCIMGNTILSTTPPTRVEYGQYLSNEEDVYVE